MYHMLKLSFLVDDILVLNSYAYTQESFCAIRGPMMYASLALPCALLTVYCYCKTIQLVVALTTHKIPVEV